MEVKNFVFLFVFVSAVVFFAVSLKRKIAILKIGKPTNRFGDIPERLKNVIKISFGQSKLLREPLPGILHFLIFWGFVLFLFPVIETIVQGFYSGFDLSFTGPFYLLITGIQDIFSVLVIISVLFALLRRLVLKVPRLQIDKKGQIDAVVILLLIFGVVAAMLVQNASSIAVRNFDTGIYEFHPVSKALAGLLFSNNTDFAGTVLEISWWTHILLVLGFMNFLPYSKHFHVITSIPNVFFGKTGGNKYALSKIDLEDENIEQFGAADVEHLTWKQILDGFSCTECGRCTSVCPAASTGKALSPRKIIVDIRKRAEEKAPVLINGAGNSDADGNTIVHNFIKDEELWACTTCNACVYECPVSIEHLDSIIDMRRNLVLMESEFPPEMNNVFRNLETNFNPWAFSHSDRAVWAEGLDIKTLAEDNNCEYLFWVGCAGSFDSRYKNVSVAFAKLMQKAGINFRILGNEEKCNGDTARRLGNEYLAQMMIMENIGTLNNYNVKKIVTACPHCFNSLKNEYPQFGGNYEVIHHSEIISNLVDSGKIELKKEENEKKITFHDSCYLGRYNNIYDFPRNPLKLAFGNNFVEMERSRDKGFCCGAGGGRMFIEETEGTKINVNRTSEVIETGSNEVASACPFCMTMLNDGIKTLNKEDVVFVKDIAEIVLENSK